MSTILVDGWYAFSIHLTDKSAWTLKYLHKSALCEQLNQISSSFIPVLLQPPSRLASILNSPGPLTLVVPTLIVPSRALSIATRLARDLDLYHKLDAEIISDSEAEQRLVDGMLGKGNIVFIGLTGEGEFARRVLREGNTPFAMEDNDEPVLTLNGEVVEGPSQGSGPTFTLFTNSCSL